MFPLILVVLSLLLLGAHFLRDGALALVVLAVNWVASMGSGGTGGISRRSPVFGFDMILSGNGHP